MSGFQEGLTAGRKAARHVGLPSQSAGHFRYSKLGESREWYDGWREGQNEIISAIRELSPDGRVLNHSTGAAGILGSRPPFERTFGPMPLEGE